MDLASLDEAVHYFCLHGIAESTHKTYKSALRKFYQFCSSFSILSPFPVSEITSYLAKQNLSPQTYLAGIRHMQITLGLPEPRAFLSLPRLKLVQAGIQRTHTQRVHAPPKMRLPITPAILRRMRDQWSPKASDPDIAMLLRYSVSLGSSGPGRLQFQH